MKRLIHLYLLSSGVLLFSCRSFKSLTAKDVSNSEQSKKKSSSNDTVFLENVSVTPGSKRTNSTEVSNTQITSGPSVSSSTKNVEVETASKVQLKYALLLDVPVEELSNTLLLQEIDHWWGTKYCLGGSTEQCTDCSGFTQNLMRDVYALNIPRTAHEQYNRSTHIKTNELQQGDLVFFQNSSHNISHVGLYIANNKFVHASVSNGVMISDLNETYWKQRYKGAGTMFK
jgi:cell wall-associated NlpC family hydrolase